MAAGKNALTRKREIVPCRTRCACANDRLTKRHRLPVRERQFSGQASAALHRGRRGRLRLRRTRQALYRWPGRTMERQCRTRTAGDEASHRRTTRQTELLFDVRQYRDRADDRACRIAVPADGRRRHEAGILFSGGSEAVEAAIKLDAAILAAVAIRGGPNSSLCDTRIMASRSARCR